MSESSGYDLPTLAGPELLGCFFNWALLGVLNVQVYLYHVTFNRDPRFIQFLVYGVLVFEWVQTGLLSASAFQIFVYHYGDVEIVTRIYNGWFTIPVMSAMISMVVQTFFAWRIYRLSKLRLLAGVIEILSLIQGSCGIASGALLKNAPTITHYDKSTLAVIIVWGGGTVIVDIIIAVTMTTMLLKMKTGIRRTDAVLNKITRMVVETGTVTASVATLALILLAGFPTSLYYIPCIHTVSKLYSNVFLTNLLNRAFFTSPHSSERGNTVDHISIALSPAVARRGSEHAQTSSTQSGDRSLAYAAPKAMVLSDPVEPL
ncbi:hypothetical protein FOMPIDRAFT_1051787 [Fomitopsis schrenkii]|uniref:DUF6534 domain-containing protein n=1 Tax=Fomitopsis schrenkii TaxID=2126942 RepID=S8FIL7_FOMSC|nr:hypothetical protein FOMPIDRAFT_1051787 [Fomitopsis schrenkii]